MSNNLKQYWHLVWKLDKWAHLSGAFMLCTIAIAVMPTPVAIAVLVLSSSALEAWQWQYQPEYPTKIADTALDLIADFVGIALAVWLAG